MARKISFHTWQGLSLLVPAGLTGVSLFFNVNSVFGGAVIFTFILSGLVNGTILIVRKK